MIEIKIKLGLVDSDRLYLERLSDLFGRKYSSQIEVHSFTDSSLLADSLRENRINILAVSQDIVIPPDTVPDSCVFVYLSDSPEIDKYNGQGTVFRYQSADEIYRKLLDIYSDKTADRVVYRNLCGDTRIVLFLPESEGAGASTAAAAFSELAAEQKEKTLFLNLRQFRETEGLFSAAGNSSLTDVIFALKSRKSGLRLKLESIVKQDRSGVYFFSSCRSPMDIAELSPEEIRVLLNELYGSCSYRNIVIVSDFYLSEQLSVLLEYSDDVVIVSGGGNMTEKRLLRRFSSMKDIENRKLPGLGEKLKIIFSGISSAPETEIPVLGTVPEERTGDENKVRSMMKSVMVNLINERRETH